MEEKDRFSLILNHNNLARQEKRIVAAAPHVRTVSTTLRRINLGAINQHGLPTTTEAFIIQLSSENDEGAAAGDSLL